MGWSEGAARRNAQFLQSVDERELTGYGVAITWTVRRCPDSPKAWAGAVDAFLRRMRRAGLIRCHWVMEFQRRGVPHLHSAAWFLEQVETADLVQAWLDVAEAFGPTAGGQHVAPIRGPVGWFQYMAKHCARGKAHYQRRRATLPRAWETTGRVWGHRGDWARQSPAVGFVPQRVLWEYRRLVQRWKVAEARRAVPGPGWDWDLSALAPWVRREVASCDRGELRAIPVHPEQILGGEGVPLRVRLGRLVWARGMRRCPERLRSRVRGLSEWMTEGLQERFLSAAVAIVAAK